MLAIEIYRWPTSDCNGASELIFIVRQHIARREVLADGVGFHDGPGQVPRHVLVVRQHLLGSLCQAVAAGTGTRIR